MIHKLSVFFVLVDSSELNDGEKIVWTCKKYAEIYCVSESREQPNLNIFWCVEGNSQKNLVESFGNYNKLIEKREARKELQILSNTRDQTL
jgi:hypothetical protein